MYIILSAILVAVVVTSSSAAFAQPTPKRHDNSTVLTKPSEDSLARGKMETTGSVFRDLGW
jgi:hypothetical protein